MELIPLRMLLYISIRHTPRVRKILSPLKSLEEYGEGKDSCYRDRTTKVKSEVVLH